MVAYKKKRKAKGDIMNSIASSQSSTTDRIVFLEPNYTGLVCYTYEGNYSAYRFVVTPPAGYEAIPSSGLISSSGENVSVTIVFKNT